MTEINVAAVWEKSVRSYRVPLLLSPVLVVGCIRLLSIPLPHRAEESDGHEDQQTAGDPSIPGSAGGTRTSLQNIDVCLIGVCLSRTCVIFLLQPRMDPLDVEAAGAAGAPEQPRSSPGGAGSVLGLLSKHWRYEFTAVLSALLSGGNQVLN